MIGPPYPSEHIQRRLRRNSKQYAPKPLNDRVFHVVEWMRTARDTFESVDQVSTSFTVRYRSSVKAKGSRFESR